MSLFSLIDFLGVAVAAVGGAFEAKRNTTYRYDLVGVLGLGLVSALGGGITRDILIQHGPPLAFLDVRYLLAAFAGAFIGLLVGFRLDRRVYAFLTVVDAAALALFAVSGSTRALNSGLSWLPALLLGITTAVGGGALRDVFSGHTPRIFESGQLYALIALFAATLFLTLCYLGFPRSAATSIAVGAGFVFRLLSLRLRWQTRAVREA
jgi:uncharacterized membrane protein YeiH